MVKIHYFIVMSTISHIIIDMTLQFRNNRAWPQEDIHDHKTYKVTLTSVYHVKEAHQTNGPISLLDAGAAVWNECNNMLIMIIDPFLCKPINPTRWMKNNWLKQYQMHMYLEKDINTYPGFDLRY